MSRAKDPSVIASSKAGIHGLSKIGKTWALRVAGIAIAILLLVALIVLVWPSPSTNTASTTTRQQVQPRQEWGVAVASTSPCDSREVPYVFEASKPAQPFNKAGQCGPVLWHKGRCIWALGYKSTTPVKLCDKPGEPAGEVPLSMEYAWSAEGRAFQDKYRLDPPRYTSILNFAR